MNRKIILASRPQGFPTRDNFQIVSAEIPQPGQGQFVARNSHLGLAPAARLRMSDQDSYAPPLALGDVVYGQTVGEIVASRHPDFRSGEKVSILNGGWQEYSLSDGAGVSRIDSQIAADTVWLGALGVSGMTAWIGVLEIGKIKAGETVVVSAASGAVGSVAGQIAKLHGCRVVGIAGGASKGAHVVNDLGFDACVDYRGADFGAALKTACPAGIDVYFDNVGGEVRDAVWPLLNQNGRVVVCGMISEYNESPRPGPAWFPILTKRLTLRGFLMSDFANRRGDFVADMSAWYRDGRVKIREDIVEGLENTPSAFIGMLRGTNFGKTIVKL